jgi:hypothetical protein
MLISSLFISICNSSSDVSFFASGAPEQIVNSELELVNAVNNTIQPTIVALNNDIRLTKTLDIAAEKNITIVSNRANGFYKLIGAKDLSTITVDDGGVLRLKGVIVTHDNGDRGRGVYVKPGGTFVLIDGEISGNNDYGAGGGVDNRGTFIMSGGKICHNIVYSRPSSRNGGEDRRGGGVYNIGTVEMSGGKIFANTAYCGGGIYNAGNFTMSGGTINSNTANIDNNISNYVDATFNKGVGAILSDMYNIVRIVICAVLIIGVIGVLRLYLKKNGLALKSTHAYEQV